MDVKKEIYNHPFQYNWQGRAAFTFAVFGVNVAFAKAIFPCQFSEWYVMLIKDSGGNMDYKQMTAPCGLDCFNCIGFLANKDTKLIPVIAEALNISPEQAENAVCKGCRNQDGKIPFIPMECNVYPCIKSKGLSFCYECAEFPCDHLHPYADQAIKVPHNTKIFNLCLIKKLGLETWAEEKAKDVKETYFNGN